MRCSDGMLIGGWLVGSVVVGAVLWTTSPAFAQVGPRPVTVGTIELNGTALRMSAPVIPAGSPVTITTCPNDDGMPPVKACDWKDRPLPILDWDSSTIKPRSHCALGWVGEDRIALNCFGGDDSAQGRPWWAWTPIGAVLAAGILVRRLAAARAWPRQRWG